MYKGPNVMDNKVEIDRGSGEWGKGEQRGKMGQL